MAASSQICPTVNLDFNFSPMPDTPTTHVALASKLPTSEISDSSIGATPPQICPTLSFDLNVPPMPDSPTIHVALASESPTSEISDSSIGAMPPQICPTLSLDLNIPPMPDTPTIHVALASKASTPEICDLIHGEYERTMATPLQIHPTLNLDLNACPMPDTPPPEAPTAEIYDLIHQEHEDAMVTPPQIYPTLIFDLNAPPMPDTPTIHVSLTTEEPITKLCNLIHGEREPSLDDLTDPPPLGAISVYSYSPPESDSSWGMGWNINASDLISSSSTTTKKIKMVRVTSSTPEDRLYFRALVCNTRLTFEALCQHRDHDPSHGQVNRDIIVKWSSAMMRDKGLSLYRNVCIVGTIPGVLVGDAFCYRAELCVVGLHRLLQSGIDYILTEGGPIATCIVSSGTYLDDEDKGDVLIYTGSGSNHRNRNGHHQDQKLKRGNLALHNNCRYGVELRVIRCHPYKASPSRKVYVYDGIYKVDSYTYGPGKSGSNVYKFKVVRLPGQGELGSNNFVQ